MQFRKEILAQQWNGAVWHVEKTMYKLLISSCHSWGWRNTCFCHCPVTLVTITADELFLINFVFSTEYVAPISIRKLISFFPHCQLYPRLLWGNIICWEMSRGALAPPIHHQIPQSVLAFLGEDFYTLYFSFQISGIPFSNDPPPCNRHIDWHLMGLSLFLAGSISSGFPTLFLRKWWPASISLFPGCCKL